MRIDFVAEPELEFAGGRTHPDARFGLMKYGPLGRTSNSAPTDIRVGLVGTVDTIERLSGWLERCRREIPAKESRQPNLFPRFPGFAKDSAFGAQLVLDRTLSASISQREIARVISARTRSLGVEQAVELFLDQCRALREKNVSVVICAPPDDLLDYLDGESAGEKTATDGDERDEEAAGNAPPEFHDLLKARTLSLVVPIQMVRRETYDDRAKKMQKKRSWRTRLTQDEATRAWNLHTALYYKAGGSLWRLVRASEYSTCFVGVTFYRSTDSLKIMSTMAQLFNELGDGVVIRGAPARVHKDDRRPHLDREGARQLLQRAIRAYRDEHKNAPARIVVHKTSDYTTEEREGFVAASECERVEFLELLSVTKSTVKLFRDGTYPPLRGTFLSLDDRSHMLYTKGSVEFFSTYPGLYVPRPLLFRCDTTAESTPRQFAQEILALTKMNWNNTQFDGGDPITVRAARSIGHILKHVPEGTAVPGRYCYYM